MRRWMMRLAADNFNLQEFGPAEDIFDLLAAHALLENFGGGRYERTRPAQVSRQDGFPYQRRAQIADDGLDFRQFGHAGAFGL